jgi:hypothetical protein
MLSITVTCCVHTGWSKLELQRLANAVSFTIEFKLQVQLITEAAQKKQTVGIIRN